MRSDSKFDEYLVAKLNERDRNHCQNAKYALNKLHDWVSNLDARGLADSKSICVQSTDQQKDDIVIDNRATTVRILTAIVTDR